MRASGRSLRASRPLGIEACEQRLVLSAQGLGELSLNSFLEQMNGQEAQAWLAEAHAATGLAQARAQYGFDGGGQTVVVIDTGIAYDHTALGAGFGAGYRVVGGWDFTEENDANPYDDGPYGSHGTHVAGIIGSSDGTYPGVAPGVDLVALRVFNDAGQGYFGWIERALQWVHANREAFENPITTVNISIGTAWNSASIPSWTQLEDEFAQLERDGIFTAVAAGNSFAQYNTPGLSYPAASSYVVPVMSVDDNGQLSSFSQRHATAIAAPGRSITSSVPDYRGNQNGRADDFVSFSGTSMATPYLAGASVLIREAYAFMGSPNVTQDIIYDLMRRTADTVYDAATGANYLRLNLGRAIDALMPGDDYSSNAAAAYRLGTVSGTRSVSGVLATVTDTDYFQFTAAQSGTITLRADALRGEMLATWSYSGGRWTMSGDGTELSFQVVAGQSYTFGLSGGGELGHYRVSIELAAAQTATQWGTVQQATFSGNNVGVGRQFAFSAARSGVLTLEAFFSNASGNVDFQLYDAAGRLVASSASTRDFERIDVIVAAGDSFVLKAVGANADVDFRVTNLVSESAGVVTVYGTSGADTFSFEAGAAHLVKINGAAYRFDAARVGRVEFVGGANDSATLTGSAGNDTATLRQGNVQLVGAGFTAVARNAGEVQVESGGGTDTANFYDTAGDDAFDGRANDAWLRGAGYDHRALGFTSVRVYATTGVDRAALFDSAGNDLLVTRPTYTRLSGGGYDLNVYGFDAVHALAASGGYDRALFYDSAGDDVLQVRTGDLRLSGGAFDLRAQSFERSDVYATAGVDRAYFYDSAGNDLFQGVGARARMQSALFDQWAYGFRQVWAYATSGGTNRSEVSAVDYLFRQVGQWV